MTLRVQVSQVIDRPVAVVFHFYADEHVRNHPRWDANIQLEQLTEGPIGVGTMIHRINRRSGSPVEGTMQVTEFEDNRAMAVLIQDGPVEMRSRVVFDALGENQTRLTTTIDIPGMDEAKFNMAFMLSQLEQSQQIRKQLIESET